MSINYTPRTWITGEIVTAAEMNGEIQTPFTGIQSAWTPYTPTLSATTTAPGLGTSPTQQGRYQQYGKTVFCTGQIIFGTGPTAGSGSYVIGLPTSINAVWAEQVGTIWYNMSATVSVLAVALLNNSPAGIVGLYDGATTNPWGPPTAINQANPAAPVLGSALNWSVVYETA